MTRWSRSSSRLSVMRALLQRRRSIARSSSCAGGNRAVARALVRAARARAIDSSVLGDVLGQAAERRVQDERAAGAVAILGVDVGR